VLPSKAATLRSRHPYAPGRRGFCPGYNASQNCSDAAPWELHFRALALLISFTLGLTSLPDRLSHWSRETKKPLGLHPVETPCGADVVLAALLCRFDATDTTVLQLPCNCNRRICRDPPGPSWRHHCARRDMIFATTEKRPVRLCRSFASSPCTSDMVHGRPVASAAFWPISEAS